MSKGIDKRRKKLIESTSKVQQHFGIRKLTTGVTSVLLGSFLIWGGTSTAQAADNVPTNNNEETSSIAKDSSSPASAKEVTLSAPQKSADKTPASSSDTPSKATEQVASSVNNEETSNKAVVQNSDAANKKDNATNESTSLKVNTSSAINTKDLNKAFAENKAEEKIPTFSGTVWFDPEGKLDPANKRTPYKAGDTQEIKYRISTYGESTIKDPQYLLLLPAGFKTDTFTWSDANAIKSTQDLGNVGPNGEQVFLVTTKTSPAWTGLYATATMTVDEKYAGAYSYADMSYLPLISALYGDAKEGGEALAGAGSPTIHLTNGTDYHVAKSIYTLNGKQWSEAGGSESYTVLPGKKAIDLTNFNVTSSSVDLHPGDATNSGYEQLNATISLTHHVEDGDYLDFHLGLPLQDGKVLSYDSQLSDGFDVKYQGTTIGHIFKMDGYYRLVFNTAVNQFFRNSSSSFTDTVHLRWNSGNADPSIKKPTSTTDHNYGKTIVYQYTSDKSQNQEVFAYTPTNDVNIGGKISASGLTIGGKYIYRGNILQGNQTNSASMGYSTNRTWDKDNHVQIDTNWHNSEQVVVATKAKNSSESASNNFAITVVAGQNPYLTYNWTSDADLANQIKNIFAHYHTHELSNPIADNNNILTQDKDTKGAQLTDGDVTVTHEEKAENGVVTRTYHVKISNPNVELNGTISPISVSASGFTMPENIKSYEEDIANAVANKKGNFGNANNQSANTSNETLKKALEDTDTIKIAVSNESGTTAKNVSGVLGSPWLAGIGYSGSNLGPNGDDPSNYITTKLIFKDVDSGNTVGPSDGFTFQGKSGTAISFNGVEQELADLIEQGYSIDHVNSKSGNTETPISPSASADKNKISSYNFGSISTASATPDEFIVYLKASSTPTSTETKKTVTETIKYVDQDGHQLQADSSNGSITFVKMSNGTWQ
ncbi:MAG: YSIRK-type signal peptide-containing protein, partial [Limosilactobacillus sp.]